MEDERAKVQLVDAVKFVPKQELEVHLVPKQELEVHGGHEEADTEHSETVFRGGHVSGKKATEGCKPVVCDEELILHDAKDAAGCQPLEMYNFIKDKMDPVNITCQGCIPHTCNHGEHDCVPVVCDVGGALEGGHSFDPCEQGHHGGDGLAWWPFMLCGLLITVMVTTCLDDSPTQLLT